jgi:hypothetical protein
LKKGILVLLVLICISVVSGASVFLNLEKEVYDVSENFEGSILVNHSGNISVNERFRGEVTGCTEYSREITLFDLLKNNGINIEEFKYYIGNAKSSISGTFNGVNKELFAFYLPNRFVNNVSFEIRGSGGPFYLDIGNDNEYDWKYLGSFTGWSDKFYSNEYREYCYPPGSSYEIIGPSTCEDISLSFDEFQGESDIRINAIVKRTGEGSLKARIGNDVCDLNNIGNDWTEVSCSVRKRVFNGSNDFKVCFTASNNNFLVPVCPGTEHHYISLQKGIYSNNLPSNNLEVSSEVIRDKVRDYLNDCNDEWCVIPVAMFMGSSGNVVLSDLNILYTGGSMLEFYELIQNYSVVDINDKELSLNGFSDLKTHSNRVENCSLRISFLDGYDSANFSVGDVPKAVIGISADYVMNGTEIIFDGRNSSAANNIVVWSWDFGDNITKNGSIVSHSYDKKGEYVVRLKVIDENGLEGNAEIVVHVIDLEDFLRKEFPSKIDKIKEVAEYFNGLEGDAKVFADKMGYLSLVRENNNSIYRLKEEFDNLSVGNYSDEERNRRYGEIASELDDLLNVPERILFKNETIVNSFRISKPEEVPDFSLYILSDKKRDALYFYNQENVRVDFKLELYDVRYLNGEEESYMYVEKNVSGEGDYLVEDLRGYDLNSDVFVFSDGYSFDSDNGLLYWDEVKDVSYAVRANEINLINSIVFKDVEVKEDTDVVIVRERKIPWNIYIILGIILILGIIYINFYKGPGNFRQVSNAISFKLFKKRLFVTERDRVVLERFIYNAMQRGFSKGQIKEALLQKGWSDRQIEYVMKRMR